MFLKQDGLRAFIKTQIGVLETVQKHFDCNDWYISKYHAYTHSNLQKNSC